mgnify:CR=1 FL=1
MNIDVALGIQQATTAVTAALYYLSAALAAVVASILALVIVELRNKKCDTK